MSFLNKIKEGLSKSRDSIVQDFNVLIDRSPQVDDEFWDSLTETLVMADIGAKAATDIVSHLDLEATQKGLSSSADVLGFLKDKISASFTTAEKNILNFNAEDQDGLEPWEKEIVLFVGINGSGKTTTVGKLANYAREENRSVLLGSADTFRAAAIEQLEEWARRAKVKIITRERGSDPASVCYETIDVAERNNTEIVLLDTAGRMHTSQDLMRELKKIENVVCKRSNVMVYTVLVIDATTGQNGLSQAKQFTDVLKIDGVVMTKLDGTAKGGIALAVSHELKLPILKIGVGETLKDLQSFNASEFAEALLGDLK
ncbi:MAG: signal recognition particle-docking protein FtsY [Eggerthellaceae bacterium]|nr:signal recognition particle-docking protein FtsY [Eggerthellaceae bacterium]